MVGDKIFLAMSNLYFFNQSRGIHVDFNVAFHLVSVLDFTNMFLVRVVVAQHEEYVAEEHSLNV
jgi:hypothetical protein